MGEECSRCGGRGLIEVHAFSSAGPITRICASCGASDRPDQPVHFRRWRGDPVQMIDSTWPPGEATLQSWRKVPLPPSPTITVWCGPPADRPYPPTPEEILSVAAWLTAPGPGRADLSGHRVYVWDSA